MKVKLHNGVTVIGLVLPNFILFLKMYPTWEFGNNDTKTILLFSHFS